MEKKTASAIMLTLLLTSMLTLAFNIQPVKASGTIYIRADGSIDPPDAPISTVDYVTYTLTANVTSDANGIVVERDNIIVDGAGYTVQGIVSDVSMGIGVSGNNVTIKNVEIVTFGYGVFLIGSSNSVSGNTIMYSKQDGIRGISSSNNNITGNQITNSNHDGIGLWGSSNYNSIACNNITANNYNGIFLEYSSNNSIVQNNITANGAWIDGCGIVLIESSSCIILGNNITNNRKGISLGGSSSNSIYHNNFVNNMPLQAFLENYSVDVWDDGYPSGGNYWSDYTGVDVKSGSSQNLPGSDDIGDTPYIIDAYNRDRYPLIKPWTPTPFVGIKITGPSPGFTFYIEPEPEPMMPEIQANVRVVGVEPDPTATTEFTWEAVIRYIDERPRDYDRNDVHQFKPEKVVGGSWKPDFKNVIAGGDLTIKVKAVVGGITYEDSVTVYIRGKNPSKGAVKSALGTLILQVICYKESYPKWHQFDAQGLPIFGLPNGFGLMQLDTPPPTSQQIWSWLANVQSGRELWREKLAMSRNYVKRVQEANSDQKVPNLSPEQHERQAAYLYRGAGPEGQYYYIWNRSTRQWEVNPNAWAPSKQYADDAMRIKDDVLTGNPPPGW
jgi:parallel beta-helix repeat protein